MNKKILSIFALIMALSFAVSCSNDSTSPDKTEDPKPTKVDATSLATAMKNALGANIPSKSASGKNIPTSGLTVALTTGKITATIDATSVLTAANDGKKTDLDTAIKAKFNDLKTQLAAQGVNIPSTENGSSIAGALSGSDKIYTIAITSNATPSKDETKYTLPTELKGQSAITVEIVIKTTATSGTIEDA